MQFKQWYKLFHETAFLKGWYDIERTLPELLCLIHSEIDECYTGIISQCADEHCPDFLNWQIELADIVISVMNLAEFFGISDDMDSMISINKIKTNSTKDVYSFMEMHKKVSEALEFYRIGYSIASPLAYLIMDCFSFEESCFDLWQAIKAKHDYNKTRTYRHGGKRI